MQPFTNFTGIAAPVYTANIDTDKLIPHRFLRKPLSAGYRNFLFYDERFTPEGTPVADHPLNREPLCRAQVLVAGPNFGCGSTREGAVYALADFGFRTLIAPSFGDIFFANCLQNGLLPVVLDEAVVEGLASALSAAPGASVAVDIAAQTITTPAGATHSFAIDAARKLRLIKGLDDIGITLELAGQIDAFEAAYHTRLTWLPKMERQTT